MKFTAEQFAAARKNTREASQSELQAAILHGDIYDAGDRRGLMIGVGGGVFYYVEDASDAFGVSAYLILAAATVGVSLVAILGVLLWTGSAAEVWEGFQVLVSPLVATFFGGSV